MLILLPTLAAGLASKFQTITPLQNDPKQREAGLVCYIGLIELASLSWIHLDEFTWTHWSGSIGLIELGSLSWNH